MKEKSKKKIDEEIKLHNRYYRDEWVEDDNNKLQRYFDELAIKEKIKVRMIDKLKALISLLKRK